jgi:hypothetical protein
MTAAERHFPSDDEVDTWMQAYLRRPGDPAPATPEADQAIAAARESSDRFRAAIPGLVASGAVQMAYLDTSGSPSAETLLRSAVRMYLAAYNAGITPLCPHCYQIRPMVIMCDPAVVVCIDCVGRDPGGFVAAIEEDIGFSWQDQCDRCGRRSELQSAVTLGGLGPFVITGHVCADCYQEDSRLAATGADPPTQFQRDPESA